MSRDYTKYTVEGLGENLNKRQLVLEIVKDWQAKTTPLLTKYKLHFQTKFKAVKDS